MKAIKNYYFILGITRSASQIEIEAAYSSWKAAAAFDEFQAAMSGEMTEAYRHLSDPGLRKQFDETLGEPPQLNTPVGNIHNLGSHEGSVSIEKEFQKERRRKKFRRKLIRLAAAVLIIAAVSGYGIKHWGKYFSKVPSVVQVSDIPNLIHIPQPAPEPEQPPVNIETVRRSQPVTRIYEVQTGGVVIRDRAPCRPQPSTVSRAAATMPKDTAILVTKEIRDGNGNLWYYVKSSQFEGWAFASDVKVYKY